MKKREIVVYLAICILFLLSMSSIKAEVKTSMNISGENVPPVLILSLPDLTWAKNTNLTNVFDLDNYFIDNETLTYSSSSVQNINVLINSTTNKVSFFPDIGFAGIRNVIFTAHDYFTTSDSNTITLNVTEDTTSPQWSAPSKDKTDIMQNQLVKFSANWADNIALSHFIFSIKQESGWVNQSPVSFTGLQNTSSFTIQISAPGGTEAYWMFHAFDTSGNINSTAIQNFTVTSSPSLSPGGGAGEESEEEEEEEEGSSAERSEERKSGFTISPEEGFLIDIKQGSSKAITIKITNIGNVDISFEIEISGLEQFIKTISSPKFNLTSGESKVVSIEFTADSRLLPDLYYGFIKIKNPGKTRKIPIVIAVNQLESEFGLFLRIPEEYKSVKPNSIVKANITLENLKDIIERNIIFYYAIKSFTGETIDSKSEEFKFRDKTLHLEKELKLPEKIKKGEYIFFARAVSGKNIIIDSDTFEVGEEFNVAGFIKTNMLFISIIVFSALFALLMLRHQKNKGRLRLLNLYLIVNELNKLLKEGKVDEAFALYVKIKSAYGEPVSITALKNKEELKKEIEKLSSQFNFTPPASIKQSNASINVSNESPKEQVNKQEKPKEKKDAKEK